MTSGTNEQTCPEIPLIGIGSRTEALLPYACKALGVLVYNWFVEREPGMNGLISGLAVGIEDVEAERETGARKVIQGKHFYIIRDNKAYSIDRKRTE